MKGNQESVTATGQALEYTAAAVTAVSVAGSIFFMSIFQLFLGIIFKFF